MIGMIAIVSAGLVLAFMPSSGIGMWACVVLILVLFVIGVVRAGR